MRFDKTPRHPFEDTARKRAHVLRKQAAERDAYPLFVDHVAAQQPSVDKVMADRADRWSRSDQRMRDLQALQWRRVRRLFFEQPAGLRQVITCRWKAWCGPARPLYLTHVINQAVKDQEGNS